MTEPSPSSPRSDGPPFFSRVDRLAEIDSTQRLVREWMALGAAEVAVAVADLQTAGRGRMGRSWTAPSGAALLLSAGFRPQRLGVAHAWRLSAIVALAMIDAAEAAAGLRDATLRLKWPNDIVAEGLDAHATKVAGVLGESVASGDVVDWAVIGIGVNVDWKAGDFPPELRSTMTSLRELAGGRPVDREALLDEFLARLEPRYDALRGGVFDAAGWSARQVTTGRDVEADVGAEVVRGTALGVDPHTGALLLDAAGRLVKIASGEVVRCRLVARERR